MGSKASWLNCKGSFSPSNVLLCGFLLLWCKCFAYLHSNSSLNDGPAHWRTKGKGTTTAKQPFHVKIILSAASIEQIKYQETSILETQECPAHNSSGRRTKPQRTIFRLFYLLLGLKNLLGLATEETRLEKYFFPLMNFPQLLLTWCPQAQLPGPPLSPH